MKQILFCCGYLDDMFQLRVSNARFVSQQHGHASHYMTARHTYLCVSYL